MATIDVMTFNGENEILKLHLSVLDPYVDKFIIVEANKTFSGESKPALLFRDERFFKPWWKKIDYYVMTEWDDPKIWEMAIRSPLTQGADHWKREFYIKESIHKALRANNVQDDDTVFIGDVDEIIDPTALYEADAPFKARLRVYSYYLNNRSNEAFWGTLVGKYGDIKDKCLNELRSNKDIYSEGDYLGWHFTSMGGVDEVRRKLKSSYTEETYNRPDVQEALADNMKANLDWLGRDFTFKTEESDWPQYLKENKKLFKDLCKKE